MKKLFLFAALSLVIIPATSADDRLNRIIEDTEPVFPFFLDGIVRPCEQCKTFVISATAKKPSKRLLSAFRYIASAPYIGKDHEGAAILRSQVLRNIKILSELGCEPPQVGESNVVYFALREESKCVKIAFEDEDVLWVALERMYSYINDPSKAASRLSAMESEERLRRYASEVSAFVGKFGDKLIDLIIAIVGKKGTAPQ